MIYGQACMTMSHLLPRSSRDVMAGCYCQNALAAACAYQPTLTVVGGSFAGYKSTCGMW